MKYMLTAFLLLLAGLSHSEIFKWTDQNGQVHFGDNPPDRDTSEEITVTVNTYTSVSYDMSVFDTRGDLLVYTKDNCGYCNKAKTYLDNNGVAYKELNLDHSRQARMQHKRMKARGVPVFLKGSQRMNGYSQSKLEKFLAQE